MVETILDAGTHKLGLDISSTTANWVAWDNAVLYYYGPVVVTESVTLNGQYEAFSSANALDFTDISDDVRAFIAVGYQNNLLFLRSVNRIPAGTGLLLRGREGTYEIPVANSEEWDDISENMLMGVTETTTINTSADGYVNYYYASDGETPYFTIVSDSHVVEAGSSYLRIPSNINVETKKFILAFEDSATAIDSLSLDSKSDGYFYTVTGVKTLKPTKGVYIHNGRKIFIK